MAWPDAAELEDFLQAAGVIALTPTTLQALLDLDGAVEAAIDDWEEATGYHPFLSTGVDETRRFVPSPPARQDRYPLLDLTNGPYGSGLVAVPTTLTVDVTYTAAGTEYTHLQHYRLLPRSVTAGVKPYTSIEFLTAPLNVSDGEVVIVGKFGYCTEANLPALARRAVLAMASLHLLPQLEPSLARGLVRWTEGDVTKQFGESGSTASSTWQSLSKDAAARYRRFKVGGTP